MSMSKGFKILNKVMVVVEVVAVFMNLANVGSIVHIASADSSTPAVTRTVNNAKGQGKQFVSNHMNNNNNQSNNNGNSVNFSNLTSANGMKKMVLNSHDAVEGVVGSFQNFTTNPSENNAENIKNSLKNEFESNPELREMIYLTIAVAVALYMYIKHQVRSYLYY